jgi:hypothetical protein
MFNLTVKQSFWINFILGVIMAVMLMRSLVRIDLIGIILYGVFSYLNWGTVLQHWKQMLYPFHTKFWHDVRKKIAAR